MSMKRIHPILGLERHAYAPELNRLHFTDGTTQRVRNAQPLQKPSNTSKPTAMSKVPNLRAFKVTFLSPTNHRGARVKIVDILTKSCKDVSDAWAKMRHTVVLPYDYGIGSIQEQAIEHMACIPGTLCRCADAGWRW